MQLRMFLECYYTQPRSTTATILITSLHFGRVQVDLDKFPPLVEVSGQGGVQVGEALVGRYAKSAPHLIVDRLVNRLVHVRGWVWMVRDVKQKIDTNSWKQICLR